MIWLKLAPYLAGLALLIGGGIWIDRHRHSVDMASHAVYVAARDAREQAAVNAALTAQKAAADAAEARNASILEKLNDREKELAAVSTDRDIARRLLSKAVATAASGSLPASQSGQPVAPAGGTEGDGSLATLVTDAIGECRRNADRLDALIAEIKPQL